MASQTNILDALNKATQADLDFVIERQKELRKELDSLAAVEKLLDVRLNGKPERAKPGTRTSVNGTGKKPHGNVTENRERIGRHLVIHGQRKTAMLAHEIGIEPANIYYAINHEWFEKGPEGVRLSKAGKDEFG